MLPYSNRNRQSDYTPGARVSTEFISPPGARRAANPSLVLALVCLAQFMVVLDATVVNVALPSIQTDLDFSDASLQWVVNAYTLMFGGFLLLGGRAADLFGRRRAVPRRASSSSPSPRCSTGWRTSRHADRRPGAPGLRRARSSRPRRCPSSRRRSREGEQRTKALGVWARDRRGWRRRGPAARRHPHRVRSRWEWIFFVNVPIGLLAFASPSRFVPESRAERSAAASTSPAPSASPPG